MTAFCSVGQQWHESRVSRRLKRCLLISRVVNTALSGIEAFCPSKAQYQVLTSSVVFLARRMMAASAVRRRSTGAGPHHDEQRGVAFRLASCDAEARVRKTQGGRRRWCKTNPAHHVHLIAALFGRLPAEQHSTLGLNGEITPDANPWAARWMADLRELEPFDDRRDVQRMGSDVRASLFWTANLTADFIAMDVTVLRFQSLSVHVPPWGFQEVAGHSTDLSEEGVPQWRCCLETECEACFGSFKALATHVLRHHRQMVTVSRLVVTNQFPACRAVFGDRNAAHRHLPSPIRRGFCRDRSRYLGQVHIPLSLCCPVCDS